jgi:hypothetical protein
MKESLFNLQFLKLKVKHWASPLVGSLGEDLATDDIPMTGVYPIGRDYTVKQEDRVRGGARFKLLQQLILARTNQSAQELYHFLSKVVPAITKTPSARPHLVKVPYHLPISPHWGLSFQHMNSWSS